MLLGVSSHDALCIIIQAGKSALIWASIKGNLNVVNALLAVRADKEVKDNEVDGHGDI